MCGNRLNAWNTIPMRRRMRSTSTPLAVISSPSMRIRPASIGSRRLMQRRSVDLPLPEAPMSATTSCSATSRSMPLSTSSSPNDFHSPWIDSAVAVARAVASASPRVRLAAGHADAGAADLPAPLLAGDQPVGEPRERDRHHAGRSSAVTTYGVKLNFAADEDLRLAEDLDDADERHQHGVLLEPDEVVQQRRDDPPDRLRDDDVAHRLELRQPERPRRGRLARVDRLDPRPVDLGHVRRVDRASGRRSPRRTRPSAGPRSGAPGCPRPSDEDDQHARAAPRNTST